MTNKNQSGVTLSWNNINATINDKQILSNISGFCNPGTALAIMGPSGAGKTTLLSILAKKHGKDLKISGTTFANNIPYTAKQFYSFAAFVFQNDILNEALTVRQTLEFIAKLKYKDRQYAQQKVDTLINQFELRKCQDTYIGGKVIKGISGGEKKRVCIAVQMVGEPQMLILDEPTSGLDSHIANNVIKIMKKLSQEGKTVIFTIHQPSYKIYSQLDRLILLDKGSVVYQGSALKIRDYMQKTLSITIPTTSTICDYFMFQISDYKAKNINKQSPLNNNTYQKYLLPEIEEQIQKKSKEELDMFQMKSTQHTCITQFKYLFARQWLLFLRNPMRFGRSVGNAILTIIIVGLIFLRGISDDRPVPIQEDGPVYGQFQLIIYFIQSQGVCFINTTSILMTGIFSVALVFPVQREVFSKETSSKTYDTLPYFISKLLIQIFTLLFSIVIFASGSYWMMGFRTDFQSFISFTFVLCVLGLVGNSIGLMTGSLFKDAQRASSMAPAFLLPLMTFSGLYNKLNDIPVWISWLQYISPFRYGLHAILLNQFQDQVYHTTTGIFDYRQDLSINLEYYQNILILLGLAVFYYSLSFLFLKKLSSSISA